MELYYCETCGIRISSTDGDIEAQKVDGKTYCTKCKPADVIPVQARRPTSGRLTRQSAVSIPAAPALAPAKPTVAPSRTLTVAGVAAGCLAIIVALVVGLRHAPEPAVAVDKKEPAKPQAMVESNKPDPIAIASPVSTEPKQVEHVELAPAPKNPEDDAASKAFEAAHREIDASTDKEVQEKLLNAFIEKYPDSLQASRARVELARFKDPKPDPKTVAKPAVDKTPAVAGNIPTGFKLKLDPAGVMPGVSDAVLAEKPPPGAHDGALRLKNSDKWPSIAGMSIWYENFPEGSIEKARKAVFTVPAKAKLRFRYFAQQGTYAMDVIYVPACTSYAQYSWRLEKPVTGEWTVQEISFEDLKGDKKSVESGTLCGVIKLGLHGPANHEFFVDELEVLSESAATVAAPPPAPPSPDIPTSFKCTFDGSKIFGIVDARVAANPPAGSSAKPYRAKTLEKHPQVAELCYSAAGFPKDTPQFQHKALFAATDGAKMRLRYFDAGLTELHLTLMESNGSYNVLFKESNLTKGAWTFLEIPLSDFKDKGGRSISAGGLCKHFELKATGADGHDFFIDCFELVAGGAGK